MNTVLRRAVAGLLILSTASLSFADSDARTEVRAALVAQGVRPADAGLRVAALTEDEARQLAARIEALPAGGNPGTFFGAVGVMVMAGMVLVALPFIVIGGIAVHAMKNGTRNGVVDATPDQGPQ